MSVAKSARLTTDDVRNAFEQTSVWFDGVRQGQYGAAFNAWLEQVIAETDEAGYSEGYTHGYDAGFSDGGEAWD